MAQCKAKAKSTGVQCRRRAVTGYAVCQVHGAGSPYKGRPGGYHRAEGGRYSKHLPIRLLARYDEANKDPERLALQEEISLVDARIADVLARVDSGEAGRNWLAARAAYDQLVEGIRLARNEKEEIKQRGQIEIAGAVNALNRAIGAGVADYAAWGEIGELLDSRRKLVESERKRLVQMKAMVELSEAVEYVRAFLDVVRSHVQPETMLIVQQEFIKMAANAGGLIVDD